MPSEEASARLAQIKINPAACTLAALPVKLLMRWLNLLRSKQKRPKSFRSTNGQPVQVTVSPPPHAGNHASCSTEERVALGGDPDVRLPYDSQMAAVRRRPC